MRDHGQRGGMLGLLLTLLALGAVLYVLLHGSLGGARRTDAPTRCERLIGDLMARTGGLGPAYAEGYTQLPPGCQKLVPAPGALDPSPARMPDGT